MIFIDYLTQNSLQNLYKLCFVLGNRLNSSSRGALMRALLAACSVFWLLEDADDYF